MGLYQTKKFLRGKENHQQNEKATFRIAENISNYKSKYWNFSFSISPSNEYSGLIFFRINFLQLVWSPCSPHSQESSPAPPFESINWEKPWCWERLKAKEEGEAKDEMVREHQLRWPTSKESACQCRRHRRHGFDPWIGKIPWSRKQQTTLVFLLGKFHGQRRLAGYCPWVHRARHDWVSTHTHFKSYI